MITAEKVSKQFDTSEVLSEISFHVQPGEFFGIIGPNGSGKSTLLNLLSGVERMTGGRVRLMGKEVSAYKAKELAKWLAVLQQDALPQVGFTVREVIEMGRYPFQNWLGEESEDSQHFIEEIMNRLKLTPYENRPVSQLSGGERQRTALAKVMAQNPKLLMLDEPTTYLDIGYQVQMMDFIRSWQKESGLTVVAVLHDLNLAAQYCDRIMVLKEGMNVAVGTPQEIITESMIQSVYGTDPVIVKHPIDGVPQVLLKSEV